MASEKTLEKKLRDRVTAAGGIAIKLNSLSMDGLPDRLILRNGKAWFAEIKSTGKKPSKLQRVMHGLLLKCGFPVWVVDTSETLDELFKEIGI